MFGLFALSDSFDELLLEEPTEEVGRKVKHCLWKGIVNPLRKLVFLFKLVYITGLTGMG